ncbi:MAG TPA: hypothetical protein VGB92_02595 [Longimicrobium sp.]
MIGSAFLVAAPAHAQDPTSLLDPSDPNYGWCPNPVGFVVPSGGYVGAPYAGQAELEYYMIGFARYKFRRVKSQDGLHAIDGFFYIDYVQCRFRPYGVYIIEFPTVTKLYSLPVACGGEGGGYNGSTQPVRATEVDYDPYDPGDTNYSSDGSCEGEGSSGGGNTGVAYNPGDYTGGGTVDWGTGIGNGGTSACGAEAVVEYICIDIMTDSGWQQWSCGYATTC